MDLRSLINKLDTIEQRKLLQESEQLMEKVRIRYSDVEAVAKQYPTDEVARGQALAKLAKDNGLPGLFDPVSRELVNPDGSLSTFKGADQATVQRLQQWGLLPQGAKTSSWLGFRGEDEKTAMGANQTAQSRDALTDKANALMDKAVQAAATPVAKPAAPASGQSANENVFVSSGIASSLLEEFGYNCVALLESITPEEHTELKKIVQDLTKSEPSDPDVVEVTTNYKNYIKQRDQIIKRIMELIQVIKSKPAPKKPVKESLQESKTRMLAEGRVQILEEGKRYLRDGVEWTYDANTKLYSHLNEDGTVEQLDEGEFWQGVQDAGRGAASGFTAGYADNISAGIQALFTNKTYKDALKAELAKTKAAQERSPWLYYGGAGLGFIANPLSKIGLGIPFMAASYASDKLVREPWNQSVVGAEGGNQGGMDANSIQAMQKEILKKDPKALPKHGADGKMGPETRAALAKYPDIAAKYKQTAAAPAQTPATAPTTAPASAPVEKIDQSVAKQYVDQLVAQAKAKGISHAEMSTLMQAPVNESRQQLDEFGWLLNALRGGAEAGIKAGAEAGVKGGAEAAANVGLKAAETLPSTVRLSGETWTKVGNNYASNTGKTMSVDNMGLQLGKLSGKEAQGLAAQNAMSNMVRGGVEAGAKGGAEAAGKGTLEAGAEAIASRFGPTARSALEKLKAGGGKVLQFMKNNKFLTAVAILAAAGYMFNSDGEVVDQNGGGGNGGGGTTSQGGMDEVSPEVTELQKLVDQLYGGWPTDPETAQALAAAKEAGAKVPDVKSGQAGMAVTGSSGTAPVSNFAPPADFAAGLDAERKAREAKPTAQTQANGTTPLNPQQRR